MGHRIYLGGQIECIPFYYFIDYRKQQAHLTGTSPREQQAQQSHDQGKAHEAITGMRKMMSEM